MSEARAKRKSPVRIAMLLVHRLLALGARLVHDVVVVQRRQVGELADDGGAHHLGRPGVAELRGQQREHGAEPLAPGRDQVAGHLADEGVLAADGGHQRRLDAGEALGEGVPEVAVGQPGSDGRRGRGDPVPDLGRRSVVDGGAGSGHVNRRR
jgi:hypothetical protein